MKYVTNNAYLRSILKTCFTLTGIILTIKTFSSTNAYIFSQASKQFFIRCEDSRIPCLIYTIPKTKNVKVITGWQRFYLIKKLNIYSVLFNDLKIFDCACPLNRFMWSHFTNFPYHMYIITHTPAGCTKTLPLIGYHGNKNLRMTPSSNAKQLH